MSAAPLNIVAFCCEHCAYAAADLAGGLRMQYPPVVKVVQLPCTGRLDIVTVLRAFEEGVDGVMAAGCLPGNCHFLEGNLNARRRVTRLQGLLGEIGLEPGRVEMFNMSAAMATEFVRAVTEMTERVTELGPSPLRVGGAGSGGD
jgi:coenzyme F420-reducing hydrogenase delta subunit